MLLRTSARLAIFTGCTFFLLAISFVRFSPTSPSILIPSTRPTGLVKPGDLENVFNQTLGFQKIFVINLPSRTDSRDSMSLAAAFTGLQVEYVDGVTTVGNKSLPPHSSTDYYSQTHLGSWRAHTDVLRKIVEQNITSALVLEDDVDWDLRIKLQMQDFAKASRLLLQPLTGTTDQFLDPSYPRPAEDQGALNLETGDDLTTAPASSPYGDIERWDLLWLGHCGTRFPRQSDENVPLGRIAITNDVTVPAKQHINVEFGDFEILDYPPHTRVVSRARVNTCILGYGISRAGARRFLYEVGVHNMTGTTDMMFRSICDGVDGRSLATCLTVQPQLFQHHRPVGPRSKFSDINDFGDGYNARAETTNIRWSTRLNFPKLINGETEYTDLYDDDVYPER